MCDIYGCSRLEGVPHAIVEERIDVRAETTHHTGRADHVFQDQCPADEKCHEFAHRYVAVNVRRPGTRYSGTELGIAKSYGEETHNKQVNTLSLFKSSSNATTNLNLNPTRYDFLTNR